MHEVHEGRGIPLACSYRECVTTCIRLSRASPSRAFAPEEACLERAREHPRVSREGGTPPISQSRAALTPTSHVSEIQRQMCDTNPPAL